MSAILIGGLVAAGLILVVCLIAKRAGRKTGRDGNDGGFAFWDGGAGVDANGSGDCGADGGGGDGGGGCD